MATGSCIYAWVFFLLRRSVAETGDYCFLIYKKSPRRHTSAMFVQPEMREDKSMKQRPQARLINKAQLRRMEGLLRLLIGMSLVRIQLPSWRDSSVGRAARTFPPFSSTAAITRNIERGAQEGYFVQEKGGRSKISFSVKPSRTFPRSTKITYDRRGAGEGYFAT